MKTVVSGDISLELDLHGTVVDEILDNAESILSNTYNLCSMEDTFVEPEGTPMLAGPSTNLWTVKYICT